MNTALSEWKIYAIRYASLQRTVRMNFLHPDKLPKGVDLDAPMRLDFFIWVAICGERVIVIDTGFNRDTSQRRNRILECDPATALLALGLHADQIADVVITHLHYDHAGNLAQFPAATFHVQEAEMGYATGHCMCDQKQNHFFEADDISTAIHMLYDGRVQFHHGDTELAPGFSLHLIGGHTAGLQIARIHTARGWVVLASDATHYFGNQLVRNPFPAIYDFDEVLRGYDRLETLADSPAHIIPGHDPEVLRIYPPHPNSENLDIVCLHAEPIAQPATQFRTDYTD